MSQPIPSFPTRRKSASYKLFQLLAVVLLVTAAICAAWWKWSSRPEDPQVILSRARLLRIRGHIEAAERTARTLLQTEPGYAPAALLVAQCANERGDPRQAVSDLDGVQSEERILDYEITAFRAGILHERLALLGAAEEAYRSGLERHPRDIPLTNGLARLLGMCGRRTEAIPLILQLVEQQEATDLLVLLARESGMLQNKELMDEAGRANPKDPNFQLAAAWHKSEASERTQAIADLQAAIRLHPDFVPLRILLGQQWLARENWAELRSWLDSLPLAASAYPQVWWIRGRIAEQAGDDVGAIHCYLQSLSQALEFKPACLRVSLLLRERGEQELAAKFLGHAELLQNLEESQNRHVLSNQPPTASGLLAMSQAYFDAGRKWEAYGWVLMSRQMEPEHLDLERLLSQRRLAATGLPYQLTDPAVFKAFRVDWTRYPAPGQAVTGRPSQSDHSERAGPAAETHSPITFRDVAHESGLDFQYHNGTRTGPAQRMYEFTGGGIAILDFDCDGWPDLFATQGNDWPPEKSSAGMDCLFWNQHGKQFRPLDRQAGIAEGGFGQGATVGDYNADGFPDLFVANIGRNELWLNIGDGTFWNVTDEAGFNGSAWTTSCLLADLSGDGQPDLYEVNYVTAPDVFTRICRHPDGSPKICLPSDFDAEPDRLWLNDGQGGFLNVTEMRLSPHPSGKGLGIVAWDAFGTGQLSLLVANDTTPSFFYVPEEKPTTTVADWKLREQGVVAGLAFNAGGKATGCMGIALGDITGDRQLDAVITNFSGEPNSVFVQRSPGQYEDQSQAVGLAGPSFEMLGFGTQFLDANLDGQLELFVANGHIDDWTRQGRAYRMPAQLFQSVADPTPVLRELPAAGLGSYFQQPHLGRAVARLDWNRDGREDLAVGHLEEPLALLSNQTAGENHSLALSLVGIQSNREAIGSTVRTFSGGIWQVRQLTAGDGYQASNERRLVFGVGSAQQVERVEISWPSGLKQSLVNLAAGPEYLVREGLPPLVLPR